MHRFDLFWLGRLKIMVCEFLVRSWSSGQWSKNDGSAGVGRKFDFPFIDTESRTTILIRRQAISELLIGNSTDLRSLFYSLKWGIFMTLARMGGLFKPDRWDGVFVGAKASVPPKQTANNEHNTICKISWLVVAGVSREWGGSCNS